MIRRLSVLTLAVLVLVGGGVAAATAYTPHDGAVFNNPSGPPRVSDRAMVHLRRTIQSTPKHGVIRIATYSFNRKDITRALVSACKRHVTVQMVLNDNWTSPQTKRLRRLLGTNIDPHWRDRCNPRTRPKHPNRSDRKPWAEPSFVKICLRSCRIGAGNQHMKFFLFSKAGHASDVVMLGSLNPTGYAARVHWNDLYTLTGRRGMFKVYSAMFRELAEDRRVKRTYHKIKHGGGLVTEFGPRQHVSRAQDPVAKRLARVRCRASKGFGTRGHTAVRITMYAWSGNRGKYLARRVADLDRHGCVVRALLSHATKNVKHILRSGGVAIRSADIDQDDDSSTGFEDSAWEQFTHEKWMALTGTFAGESDRIVWTGSENWSDTSLHNDEVTLKIPWNKAHRQYAHHFEFVWKHHSRAFGGS